ncbi:MAG: transposase [Nostoc sp. DedQUE04]|uniref:transposase n=1 Tax=Nostoc sp. DedQUE04 TaxID=3075390 RepID=UPI002AD528F1|nr:transposase [Nostoc sp. DedQUE04]MDZ8139020.1 transposase [Nostoc sp. DedQUE04]
MDEQESSMAHKYLLSYYYVSPQDAERIDTFREVSGDTEKTLVTQYVRGWIGRHRDYYQQLAKFDALHREISFRQWAEIVVLQGVEALPPYKHEVKDIPDNPLKDVVLSPDVVRRGLNYIMLGTQNLAFLRIGIHYDRDNAVGFVSRIVREQFDRNWDKLYLPQVEAENFENWI